MVALQWGFALELDWRLHWQDEELLASWSWREKAGKWS